MVIKEGRHLYGQGILVQFYIHWGGVGDTTCLSLIYYSSVKDMYTMRYTCDEQVNMI